MNEINEIKDKKKIVCWTYLDKDEKLAIKINPELSDSDKKRYKAEMIKNLKKIGVCYYFI